MTRRQRAVRAAFVALAVGLGWGIRGNFGHQLGAMVPGALLAMSFAYVSGQDRMFRLMPALAFVGALTMSLGGTMSYGTLHGYAKSPSFVNYTYGYFTLFLCGAVWGGPCGAGIGLLLESKPTKLREWAGAVWATILWGLITFAVVVSCFGFHINPPRSDISVAFVGGMIGLFVWLHKRGKWFGLKGALWGAVGFGLSMTLSRLLGNASYMVPFIQDNWKVMEIGCGMIGGFILSYALLGKEVQYDELPPWAAGASYVGLFFVMVGIPVLHWIQRMPRKDTIEKVVNKKDLLVADRGALIDTLQNAMLGLQIVAVVGALIWLVLHVRNKVKGFRFPILIFALILLLTSNIRSVWPLIGIGEAGFQVQAAFCVIYLLMIVFMLFPRPRPVVEPEWASDSPHVVKAVLASVLIFAFMIAANAPIDRLAGRYGKLRSDGTRSKPSDGSNDRFPLAGHMD